MKITVIGTGYVGLVLGTCLSDLGNSVICVDIDKLKIEKLKQGVIPIYEPGLDELVKRNYSEGRLLFTTSIKDGVEGSDVIFIAVGTPQSEDGKADLRYVEAAAAEIGRCMNGYKVIINKSTVPVGTADLVKEIIKKNQTVAHDFDVVSNPEFLKEGSAVKDFQNPDRVVIGVESEKAEMIMRQIFKAVERADRQLLVTTPRSAELIKYASNSFLATKISFINEIANFCEKVGADVKAVARGMGLDKRIGTRFLSAGIGYGGSCFPKDVDALIATGKKHGQDFRIIAAAQAVNKEQKLSLVPKIKKVLPDLKGKKIAVWGLAFKPKTDDIREAPSLAMILALQKDGASIRVFDPVAMDNAKNVLKDVEFGTNPYDTLEGCDALVIITEWDVFRELDKQKIKNLLKQPNIIDGRNVYDPYEMKELGFNYFGVGRGN